MGMEGIEWLHLFSQLYSLICTSSITAVFLSVFALCLQSRSLRFTRMLRALVGTALAVALMLVSPIIYRRSRQHMGVGLATMTYMAALTMLDWCMLQSTAATPSVAEMLSSFVWHPMSGIIQSQASKAGSNAADSDDETEQNRTGSRNDKEQQKRKSMLQLLMQHVSAMLRLALLLDVTSAILECLLCYGTPQPGRLGSIPSHSSPTLGPVRALASILHHSMASVTALLPHYVAAIAFKLCTTAVASLVLGMQLESCYMLGRLGLIVCKYPHIGPIHIFDNPWMADSVSDLWSNRWHQTLRYYFTGLGYGLADRVTAAVVARIAWVLGSSSSSGNKADPAGSADTGIQTVMHDQAQQQQQQQQQQRRRGAGIDSALHRQLKRAIRTLVVFAISGLVHVYVVWAAFGIVSWRQLAFFMLHGLAVITENLGSLMTCYFQGSKGESNTVIPCWMRRVWVIGFSLLTAPMFIDIYLQQHHYQSYVPPFLVPITTRALQHAGLCDCNDKVD